MQTSIFSKENATKSSLHQLSSKKSVEQNTDPNPYKPDFKMHDFTPSKTFLWFLNQ